MSLLQQHSTFTVQTVVYKCTVLKVIIQKPPLHVQLHNSTPHLLYSLQVNCTYSNYTEAAATCSAAQQHTTFTVQNVQSTTELYLQ